MKDINYLFHGVTFMGLMALVMCCPRTQITYPDLPIVEKEFIFTISVPGMAKDAPKPRVHRFVIQPSVPDPPMSGRGCPHAVPGIHHMFYGVRKNFFSANDSDLQPPITRFMEMNCKTNKQLFRWPNSTGFQVPDVIEDINIRTRSIEHDYTRTFSSYAELVTTFAHISTRGFWNQYVREVQKNVYTKVTRISRYHVEEMDVTLSERLLRKNLRPEFTDAFNSLPSQYEGHEWFYQEFIRRWGSHFHSGATLGGRVFLIQGLWKMDDKSSDELNFAFSSNSMFSSSLSEFSNQIDNSSRNLITSQYIVSEGGHLYTNRSLIDWANSLVSYSVPIGGTLLSMDSLFEDATKASEFEKAIADDERVQRLKALLIHIENMEKNKVRTLLLKIVREESKSITPRQAVVDALDKVVKAGLQILTLRCGQIKATPGLRMKLAVLHGVCVTSEDAYIGNCDSPEWDFEVPLCVDVFTGRYCEGSVTQVRSADKMGHYLQKTHKSWMICSDKE